ncbi:uncharacterized protein CDAR_266061 [Caerostris darwini]|uniref:Uncharacterized protein n=1 Tax=Caerostris darwini TaxID=1538125 RepID=A0AAV4QQG7_9ARAC|nr:uncharacterized protein CDAR_266061 [Caerostris darwini]
MNFGIFKHSHCPFDVPNVDISMLSLNVAYEFENAYINHCTIFSFAAFYILHCSVINNSLSTRKKQRVHAIKLYKTLLQNFESMEDTLSRFVLFLFVRIFSGFFLSLYALLYAARVQNVPIPNMSFADFFTHVTVMMIVVLSADHAQKKADKFRLSLYEYRRIDSSMEGSAIDSLRIRSI